MAGSAARSPERAVGFGCTVIGANRSPIADKGEASEIYPLAELDRMLPQCDVRGRSPPGWRPETRGLIDARRLGADEADGVR